jgi:hypothetical protein
VPPTARTPPSRAATLLSQARDIDISASAYRNLLVGGGISGFCAILCAATIAEKGSSVGAWFWQLVFGVIFLWFVTGARGALSGRGFLVDRSGLYMRTKGEVLGVPWEEVSAVGIGSLPWIQHRRPVHPGQRHAFEFYPADLGFPARHPEFERWLIEEPPTVSGLPSIRYRFFLPPFGRLARDFESAVQAVAARKWVGHYWRKLPQQGS